MHLHVEIENLRQRLLERDNHIVTMETQFLNEADKFPNGELASMKEELLIWQEKYSRLYEAHKRVQKVNQNLEDKLLRIVDKCETEKGAFTKDIATLSHRLADANYTIHQLTQDNVSIVLLYSVYMCVYIYIFFSYISSMFYITCKVLVHKYKLKLLNIKESYI